MNTNYQMWITYNAESEKLRIPVLPETFTVSIGSNNSSVNIVGLGEIVIKQARPAFQFSFSSFFPATSFPGVNCTLSPPLSCVDKLKNWQEGEKPVHLILTDLGVNVFCTIERFNYYEQGGDVGTIHYDLTLKEYREVAAKQVKVDAKSKKATVENTEARVDNSVQPKTYTVAAGDCLWSIAQRLMGDGSRYKELYNANKSVIDPRNQKYNMPAYTIYAGQVLSIPEQEALNEQKNQLDYH